MMIACSLRTVVSTYLIFMYSGCRPNLYQRGCNRLEGGEIVNPFMSCPIVLSSFSCFQSQIFLSSLRCSLSLAISSRVNFYLFCVFLWINILLVLRYSSRQSIHLLFCLPIVHFFLLVCIWWSFWSFCCHPFSVHGLPLSILLIFWCCIWFLVAVSFFWLLHSCKWFLVFLWAICSLWHSVSSSPPDSVNDSTIHALMLALVWRMHWIFSFYFWGCDVSFEMCL